MYGLAAGSEGGENEQASEQMSERPRERERVCIEYVYPGPLGCVYA